MSHEQPQSSYPDLTNIKMALKEIATKMELNQAENIKEFSSIKSQLHIVQERISRLEHIVKNGRQYPTVVHRGSRLNNGNGIVSVDDIHKQTISENLWFIVQNLNLENTLLLDELMTENCLTSDEATAVRRKPNNKDKIRKLMCTLGIKCKDTFSVFLSLLEKDNKHIADHLRREVTDRTEKTKTVKICIICMIKKCVNLKDVIDKLSQHKIVGLDFIELVVSTTVIQEQGDLWDALFSIIDGSADRRQEIRGLQEALARKHENIAAYFSANFPCRLLCHCDSVVPVPSFRLPGSHGDSSGSTGDVSTTYPRDRQPDRVSDDIVSECTASVNPGANSQNDINSQDGATSSGNIPKTFTADWIVNAPFHLYESDYPELNAMEATLPSEIVSPGDDSSVKFQTVRKKSCQFKKDDQISVYNKTNSCSSLKHLSKDILKKQHTNDEEDTNRQVRRRESSGDTISKENFDFEVTNPDVNFDVSKRGISKPNERKAIEQGVVIENQSHTKVNQHVNRDSTSEELGSRSFRNKRRKKKKRKNRDRAISEPSQNNDISFSDQNLATKRASSLESGTRCREKTDYILDQLLSVENSAAEESMAETKPSGSESYGKLNNQTGAFPIKDKQIFAHEQPIITPSKKVDPFMAGLPTRPQSQGPSNGQRKKGKRK